jgi:hypothetical protein
MKKNILLLFAVLIGAFMFFIAFAPAVSVAEDSTVISQDAGSATDTATLENGEETGEAVQPASPDKNATDQQTVDLKISELNEHLFAMQATASILLGQKTLELPIWNRSDSVEYKELRFDCSILVDFEPAKNCEGRFDSPAPQAEGVIKVPIDFPANVRADDTYLLNINIYEGDKKIDVQQIELYPDYPLKVEAGFFKVYSTKEMQPASVNINNTNDEAKDYYARLRIYSGEKQVAEKEQRAIVGKDAGLTMDMPDWWSGIPEPERTGKFRAEAEVKAGEATITAAGNFELVSPLEVGKGDKQVTVGNKKFQVVFDKASGKIVRVRAGERTFTVYGPALNTWRPLLPIEKTQPSFKDYFLLPLLKGIKTSVKSFDVTGIDPEFVTLTVRTFNLLANRVDQSFSARYDYRITPDGIVTIAYQIEPKIGPADLLELGLKFNLPAELNNITVIGRGPDTYQRTIQNPEQNPIRNFSFKPGDPGFSANRADVVSASFESGNAGIEFVAPTTGDYPGPQNMRAENGAKRYSVFFNPWMKNPYVKYVDPPPEYSISVRDGDVMKSAIEIHFIGD